MDAHLGMAGRDGATGNGRGQFVISLDFELMWGVRDHMTKDNYGARVLGERPAIPAMLELFERHQARATWATVGFVLCDGRDELEARAPRERPTYADPSLSNYAYLDEVGPSEAKDPYYFAPSMGRLILSCPGQELATQTFSHYYCLEPGQTLAQFSADLAAAMKQLADWGVEGKSIVFPRNQYGREHLAACEAAGLTVYRGNARSWMYRPARRSEQSLVRRALRLADSYLPITDAAPADEGTTMVNVPASRFLRPHSNLLKAIDGLRLKRITQAMTAAARAGELFHLWWHPHNFGGDTEENLAFLAQILKHYRRLADEFGMQSATMAEAAGTETQQVYSALAGE